MTSFNSCQVFQINARRAAFHTTQNFGLEKATYLNVTTADIFCKNLKFGIQLSSRNVHLETPND